MINFSEKCTVCPTITQQLNMGCVCKLRTSIIIFILPPGFVEFDKYLITYAILNLTLCQEIFSSFFFQHVFAIFNTCTTFKVCVMNGFEE